MAALKWKEEYSVGISSFDEDHRTLLSYINQVKGALKSDKQPEVVSEILGKLVEYAKHHFKSEERYMDITGYPQRLDHVEEHKAFLKKVVKLCSRANHDPDNVYDELTAFLENWLDHHILTVDMDYFRFYREKDLL